MLWKTMDRQVSDLNALMGIRGSVWTLVEFDPADIPSASLEQLNSAPHRKNTIRGSAREGASAPRPHLRSDRLRTDFPAARKRCVRLARRNLQLY